MLNFREYLKISLPTYCLLQKLNKTKSLLDAINISRMPYEKLTYSPTPILEMLSHLKSTKRLKLRVLRLSLRVLGQNLASEEQKIRLSKTNFIIFFKDFYGENTLFTKSSKKWSSFRQKILFCILRGGQDPNMEFSIIFLNPSLID